MTGYYTTILVLAFGAGLAAYLFLRAAGPRLRMNSTTFVGSLSPRVVDHLFWLLPLMYTLVFGWMSIASYLSFSADGYDLSIFDQSVWNSLRGHLFEVSALPDAPLTIGQHFSPILLAFVPLYAIKSSAIVLLIVQTLGIAASAFPLYWFGRERLGRAAAFAVVLAYFLYPALQGVNQDEFHELAFAIPLFAYATYFLVRDQTKPFLVCVGLSLLVKEDMAFVATMFGLYVLLVQRRRWLGLGLTLFGVAWAVLLLEYILPFLHGDGFGGGYYYFGHGIAGGMGRYDYLGNSLSEIVLNALTRPDLVLPHALTQVKIDFSLALFVPLAFMPLIGAELAALALPTLGTSLLSDYARQFSIQSHHPASMLPFLFFGTVLGLSRLVRWGNPTESAGQARRTALIVLLLVASAASYYYLSPGPLARQFEPSRYILDAHTELGHALLKQIPPTASVMAQGELEPHLSDRALIYGFPMLDYCDTEYLAADTKRPKYELYKSDWEKWLGTGHFDIFRQDGFIFARRKSPDQLLDIRFEDGLSLVRYTAGALAPRGGQPLCPIVAWNANAAALGRYVMQAELLDARGHLFARDEHVPKDAAGDQFKFLLVPTVPAGKYDLKLRVLDSVQERYLIARDSEGRSLGDEPVIATIPIEKDKSSVTASQLQIEQPFFVDMEEMRLLGYANMTDRFLAGDTLALGIYWRARGKPRGDYSVSVELRDASDRVVAAQSSRPVDGAYPTTMWDQGEVVLDWHDLLLPRDLTEGRYSLIVILKGDESKTVLGQAPVKFVYVAR